MLWVYLAALIVGAGTLLLQAVLGHDADGDTDLAHDTDQDHDAGGASLLFSARFWIFLSLAFGLSGALLTLFRLAGPTLIFVLAAGSGLLAGLLAAWVIRSLKRGQVSGVPGADEAVGRIAEVLIPCEQGRIGKVRLQLRGQTMDLLARGGDEAIGAGSKVVIEDIEGGIARVSRAPDEIVN
jgi:membrane protein implicated in regulation of membrane protease activity